jgi:hypothetical protein
MNLLNIFKKKQVEQKLDFNEFVETKYGCQPKELSDDEAKFQAWQEFKKYSAN